MKVLVLRFSSIGDIVLTSPILRCLKQQKPGIIIHYITKAAFRSVVAHNPNIDKHFYLEDDLSAVVEDLKKEKYDYIIDLHHNLRSLRIKKALGIPSYTFPKLNIRKWLLVNFKVNMMPDKSIVDRYFEAVKPLGVHNDGQGLDYFIPEHAQISNKDIPMSHWAGYVGFVIGGTHNTKKFPVEKWQELCKVCPYPIILVGGPDDRDDALLIASADSVKVYNACGKFSINESAALIQYAKAIVSNDTGMMHIATAFKKTVISLWGNTSPEMGMFPYYGYNNLKERVAPNSIIFENKALSCHPCSKIGYSKCPKGHFRCMKELDVYKINEYLIEIWKKTQL